MLVPDLRNETTDALMSLWSRSVATIVTGLLASSPAWAQPSSQCGDAIRVNRSDTLSSIAARCDTTEARILRANPGLEGSDDLRVGRELNLKADASSAQRASEQLGALAREAGSALSGMAQGLGSSIDDLLDKNPDLRQRLRGLGDRLNMPGVDVSKAQVSLSPGSGSVGTTVTVSAAGLPANTAVVIGGGGPRAAYEVLDQARTTAEGTLHATIRIPDWAIDHERFIMTVAAEAGDWKVRSAPFQISGTKL